MRDTAQCLAGRTQPAVGPHLVEVAKAQAVDRLLLPGGQLGHKADGPRLEHPQRGGNDHGVAAQLLAARSDHHNGRAGLVADLGAGGCVKACRMRRKAATEVQEGWNHEAGRQARRRAALPPTVRPPDPPRHLTSTTGVPMRMLSPRVAASALNTWS